MRGAWLRVLAPAVLLGCSAGAGSSAPAPSAAPVEAASSGPSAPPPMTGTATGAATATMAVGPAAEVTATATAATATTMAGAASAAARSTFHCFSWIHLHDHSTDCYRTAAECEAERKQMERGARPTMPCQKVAGGSCTMVSRPPQSPTPTERCFGNANGCQVYRNMVNGRGLTSTPCEER